MFKKYVKHLDMSCPSPRDHHWAALTLRRPLQARHDQTLPGEHQFLFVLPLMVISVYFMNNAVLSKVV